MKKVAIAISLSFCFILGLLVVQQAPASADPVASTPGTAPNTLARVPVFGPGVETLKSCNFNSDCPYGKCDKHVCGGCNFNSDCKGWGKCSGHRCGGCNFDSDCKGWGKCSGQRCTKSPY